MLTVLNICNEKEKGLRSFIRGLMQPYEIRSEIKEFAGVSTLNLYYRRHRGDIRLEKLYPLCPVGTKTIVCSPTLSLHGSDFRRFESTELNSRLCENYVCDILSEIAAHRRDIKISFYDPQAESPSFAEKLLYYSSNVMVVSEMPRFYENEAARIAASNGAVMNVSNSLERLYPCDILIAPVKVKRPLPTVPSSVTMTICRPLVPVSGTVIHSYHVPFPERYIPLLPDGIDENYFLSALYSLSGASELGAMIPDSCSHDSGTLSRSETAELILRRIK